MESQIHDARVSLPTDDAERLPLMQVEYIGGTRPVTRIVPAPLFYNPKPNDFVALLDIEGSSEDQEGIVHNLDDRKKMLYRAKVVYITRLAGVSSMLKIMVILRYLPHRI